jgi:hypothetical protein
MPWGIFAIRQKAFMAFIVLKIFKKIYLPREYRERKAGCFKQPFIISLLNRFGFVNRKLSAEGSGEQEETEPLMNFADSLKSLLNQTTP